MPGETIWVDDWILEDFGLESNRVNNIDPIEGMSMMDIARLRGGEEGEGRTLAGEGRGG